MPKIPSMRVTDLARPIAPALDTHKIGIRPGEKLYELMISQDDARTTLELPDRYIIEPAFVFWTRRHLENAGARPVAEGFNYRRDTKPDWLDLDDLVALLKDTPA